MATKFVAMAVLLVIVFSVEDVRSNVKEHRWGNATDVVRCTPRRENIPIPEDCRMYYKCRWGKLTRKKCPYQMKFDVVFERCLDKSLARCYKNTKVFACPAEWGNYRHNRCDRYWSCYNYEPILRRCPPFYNYSERHDRCVLFINAGCRVIVVTSTTTPKTTTTRKFAY